MVSSIVPGATGAGALAVDPRLARSSSPSGGAISQEQGLAQDRVEVSAPAAFAAARDSVTNGLAQVQQALLLARDAQAMLLKAQGAAADGAAGQADLNAALDDYGDRFSAAQTNPLVKGQDLSVNAEPGSPPLTISGADLALGGDIVGVSHDANAGDSALSDLVQTSLDRLQGVMEKLGEASNALEAHQGFLGAAQNSISGVTDLNADSARLLALQVRQGLEANGARAIANVDPQAVLALFRA